jgi:hypothetical protein
MKAKITMSRTRWIAHGQKRLPDSTALLATTN